MQPFLKTVAQHLFDKYGKDLYQIEVVLPTRRACAYFSYYLAEVANQPLLSPDIMAMDDFIKRMADVTWMDSISLLFELFKCFRNFDTNPEHDLEKFAPLGNAMLKDFSMIDKNITPKQARELFEYLDELKAIDRWAEEQLGKPIEVKEGSSLQSFFSFWKHLASTFFYFRATILQENKAYSGLAYRQVVENLEAYLEKEDIKQVAFVGFNQMSRAEENIIAKLIKINKAETYWDADRYYLDNPQQEAGDFIRKYAKLWLPKPLDFVRDDFRKKERKINIINMSNQVSQTKVAGEILWQILKEAKETGGIEHLKNTINHTAILLPDEDLMMPLLHALPYSEAQKELGIDLASLLNITMGLSIKKTPLFDFVEAMFKLQDNLSKQGGGTMIYHKDLMRILNNSVVQTTMQATFPEFDLALHVNEIRQQNLVYISLDSLAEAHPFFQTLFMPWQEDVQTAIQHFYTLVEHFAKPLAEQDTFNDAFLITFFTTLQKIENAIYQEQFSSDSAESQANREEKTGIRKPELKVTIRIFRQFLFEALQTASVPFTGEPLSPIQIMGMLESRALDFERVILLSCNEGTVPPGKLLDSILPFDLRRSYQLPTHKESDSSVAYVFYRLFQEAKEVWLLHTDPSGSFGGKEKSRFVMQVEQEFTPENGFLNTSIEHFNLTFDLPNQQEIGEEIVKDDYVLGLIKAQFAKGLSPSAINSYIKNPLEFFERSILKLKEAEEIEEEMARHTFGTLIHETLDRLFQQDIGKHIYAEHLDKLLNSPKLVVDVMEKVIEEECGGIVTNQGKNFILKKVAERLINNFLQLQKEKEAGYFLVDQENFLGHTIQIELPSGELIPFRISGKADRIDCLEVDGKKTLRVVDYKTGSFYHPDLKAVSQEALFLDSKKGKIVQLLLYKYLLIKAIEKGELKHLPKDFNWKDYQILSGFFFFSELKRGFIVYELDDEANLERQSFCQYVEQFITNWVIDVLDDSHTLSKTPSEWNCLSVTG